MQSISRHLRSLLLLAAAAALVTQLASGAIQQATTAHAASEDLVRLGGRDRYETAAVASQQQFAAGAASAVVLASGQNFPDALSGGPLAAALNAPLLLTRASTLPSATAAEIVRTLPSGRTVFVLGGTSAVSDAVTSLVGSLGYSVERIAGSDRIQTALAVATRLHQLNSAVLPYYVANGFSFPDALSVAPKAAIQRAPIVLTRQNSLPSTVTDHLNANRSSVGVVTVVGGTAAVSQAVQDLIGSSGFATNRLAGTDRYGTSRAVADTFVQATPAAPTGVGLASGLNYPDALSAGSLLASRGWPVLLVKPDLTTAGCLTTADFLQDNAASIGGGFVHGGTAAISVASETFAEELIDGSRTLPCGVGPTLAGCQVFPSDNPWNADVSQYPVHANSDAYIASINAGAQFLHADFGSNPDYGIPITVVPASQPGVPMTFDVDDESDPGPYPFPSDARVEVGSDHHVLVVQQGSCKLYETYDSTYVGPGWEAYSGAVFDLASNALRPDTWTSADAAGLPIAPGLVRYDEVTSGAINHAVRFTVSQTQRAFIHPATHFASSSTDPSRPPMGLRLRLKSSYDISGFTGQARVVLEALKKYGMIVADNGTDWFITGETDSRWDDEDLDQLKTVPGSVFEAVETGPLIQ